jgi:hypothetical protein
MFVPSTMATILPMLSHASPDHQALDEHHAKTAACFSEKAHSVKCNASVRDISLVPLRDLFDLLLKLKANRISADAKILAFHKEGEELMQALLHNPALLL